MFGVVGGFSAFFALLPVVPELSAGFRALDDEEFFVIEGSCQLVFALSAGILRVDRHMCQRHLQDNNNNTPPRLAALTWRWGSVASQSDLYGD